MMEASVDHVHTAPPSYSGVVHGQGTSHNQLHDTTTKYRQLADQTAENVEEKKAPSFTALVHGQGNSYTHDENAIRGGDGQAPSVGAMGRGTVSQPSGGDPYSGDQAAPSREALNKRDSSQTGGSSVVFEGADVQEFVGMSLVGKNFRKFYPNAYYKEKDGDN